MKRILLLYVLLTGCFATLQAQQKKAQWYVQPGVTLLNGDKYASVAVNAFTGIHYRQWYWGVGTGIDYYKVRSIPLMAEVKFERSQWKTAPFLYARAGYNAAWALDHQHTTYYGIYRQNSVYNNGGYVAVGVGLQLLRVGNNALAVTLGYSTKSLDELYDEYVWTGTRSVPTTRKLDYTFRRLDIGLSYRF